MAPLSEAKVETALLRDRAIRSLRELPPFSPILNRLLASLAQEDVSFMKLGDLVEKDPVLAGNLLHLVNSALYARRGSINSVRHALSLLGINKLRNVVLGMSISRMWNQVRTPPSWSMARFNMHSAACAILSDLLAQQLTVNYAEGAFVAGLLHDVGRLLIALGLSDDYTRIVEMYDAGSLSLVDYEKDAIGVTHPELSSEAMLFWKLPEQIQTAVLYHHSPELDPSTQPKVVSLSKVVDAANQYVNSMGVSILKKCPEVSDSTLVDSLGLPEGKIATLLVDFKNEYDAMSAFFK